MNTTPARPTDRRQRIIDAIERLHDTGGVYALDYGEAGRIADAVIAADTAHAAEVRAAALTEAADAVATHTGNPIDANAKMLRRMAAAARPDDTTGA